MLCLMFALVNSFYHQIGFWLADFSLFVFYFKNVVYSQFFCFCIRSCGSPTEINGFFLFQLPQIKEDPNQASPYGIHIVKSLIFLHLCLLILETEQYKTYLLQPFWLLILQKNNSK